MRLLWGMATPSLLWLYRRPAWRPPLLLSVSSGRLRALRRNEGTRTFQASALDVIRWIQGRISSLYYRTTCGEAWLVVPKGCSTFTHFIPAVDSKAAAQLIRRLKKEGYLTHDRISKLVKTSAQVATRRRVYGFPYTGIGFHVCSFCLCSI